MMPHAGIATSLAPSHSQPQDAAAMLDRNLLVYVPLICLALASASANENWPQWRGPDGNGTSDSKNLPTTWSLEKNENIVWKAELPSWSGGTPVIWGDHVFITSPNKSDGGPEEGGGGRQSRAAEKEAGRCAIRAARRCC